MNPFLRTAYNYDTNQASLETGLECKDQSLTQQQFLEESDINFIANRYGLTGEMPTVKQAPAYGDFTGVFDYQTAQNALRSAQEAFMALPAKVRTRFQNEPQNLLDFLQDDENRDEAVKLGILNKKQPEATIQPPPATTEVSTPVTPAKTTET